MAFVAMSLFAIEKYLESPSLFIEPVDNKSRTNINLVLEADNIEGLKKVCSLWAAQEDRATLALNHYGEEAERLKSNWYWFLLVICSVFTYSSGYLYYHVKRYKREIKNEL